MQIPTDAVLSDTGHFPNVIKYWLKMLNAQADDPLRNAFDTFVQLHNLTVKLLDRGNHSSGIFGNF